MPAFDEPGTQWRLTGDERGSTRSAAVLRVVIGERIMPSSQSGRCSAFCNRQHRWDVQCWSAVASHQDIFQPLWRLPATPSPRSQPRRISVALAYAASHLTCSFSRGSFVLITFIAVLQHAFVHLLVLPRRIEQVDPAPFGRHVHHGQPREFASSRLCQALPMSDFAVVGPLALNVGVVHQTHETFASTGGRPLQHCRSPVGVAESEGRPLADPASMLSGLPGPSSLCASFGDAHDRTSPSPKE